MIGSVKHKKKSSKPDQTPAEIYFSPWEGEPITSWKTAISSIDDIIELSQDRTYVWRGQVDAGWSLHSSLYRRLIKKDNRNNPVEDDLIKAEIQIRDFARDNWRFDDQPYLQLLAQLQHFRAPTRLLDVTLNPLVALWFAVEKQLSSEDDQDARLFVFDVTNRTIVLDDKWSTYDIPWLDDGQSNEWCREAPLFWRPPAYNDRIPAQQAGFLLAGVPKAMKNGFGITYRKGRSNDDGFWKMNEVRAATSVPFRPFTVNRSHQSISEPCFTIRISKEAKPEIRKMLEKYYGLNQATMYPDPFGMAFEVRKLVDSNELL